MRLRLPVVRRELHHETDGSERIEHEDRVLSRGRISACVHKRHSGLCGFSPSRSASASLKPHLIFMGDVASYSSPAPA